MIKSVKKRIPFAWYGVLFFVVFGVDRFTKNLALTAFIKPYVVTSWLTLELTFNRGVSWGMLHTENSILFFLLTVGIVCMVSILAWYAFRQWRQGYSIIGETLALSGALSNIVDRFLYSGVVDFILFTIKGCAPFGIFNVADVCIVLGIFLIFVGGLRRAD